MTIYDLKPAFQNLLRPIVKAIHAIGISPNQVTIITCLLSIIYSIFLYMKIDSDFLLYSVPIFFFIRMALNAIDGVLAKEYKLTSNLGAILNEVTDLVSDAFLYLAFFAHPLINGELLVVFTILAATTELTGLSALHIGAKRRFDGPMGKSDRAFVISVIALLLASTNIPAYIYSYILIILSLLCLVTIYNRIEKSLNEVKN